MFSIALYYQPPAPSSILSLLPSLLVDIFKCNILVPLSLSMCVCVCVIFKVIFLVVDVSW